MGGIECLDLGLQSRQLAIFGFPTHPVGLFCSSMHLKQNTEVNAFSVILSLEGLLSRTTK